MNFGMSLFNLIRKLAKDICLFLVVGKKYYPFQKIYFFLKKYVSTKYLGKIKPLENNAFK